MNAAVDVNSSDEQERLRRFGKEVDRVRARVEGELGERDVHYIKRMRRISLGFEAVGRMLIHISFEPVLFVLGVFALFLHKQLEATEIGHTALHRAFDDLPGAEAFWSKGFRWDTPINEESWKMAHNVRHHQYTNVAGRDPDIHFGPVRLNRHTPHQRAHYFQVLYVMFEALNFSSLMNLHVTGVVDALGDNGRPERFDFLPDRSPAEVRGAWKRAGRSCLPHYAKEYLLYPALAGSGFFKVVLGNWLAATLRDVYSTATIYCGHVGEDVSDYPPGTQARSRGEWYAMQIGATNNFEVPFALSLLCGALDLQIEHHLFPRFPTNRLREVAPEIRQLCADFGIPYRSEGWGRTLAKVFRQLWRLSFPDPPAQPAAAS